MHLLRFFKVLAVALTLVVEILLLPVNGQKKVGIQLRTPAPGRSNWQPPSSVSSYDRLTAYNSSGHSRYSTDEEKLIDYVMRGYRDLVRPAKHPNETIIIITRIFPIKIQEVIEKDEILHLAIRLQFGWLDKRLRWNPANFSDIKSIILPGHHVWIPDLQFINSADDMYAILGSRQFAVKIHSDGTVWWHPTGSIKLRCELDLNLFPFDHQRCKVILESVIYTHEQLNLTVRQDKTVSFSMYRENGLWEVTGGYGRATLDRATASTAFSRVEFVLHMRRRTAHYVNNYIIPCFLLSCLQVLTFLIPLKNPERLTHATSVLLSLIVFQTIIFSELPKTASSLPLLARYLMALSIVSVLAIGSCVFVSYLISRAEKCSKSGETIQVGRFLAKSLRLRVFDPSSDTFVSHFRLPINNNEFSPATAAAISESSAFRVFGGGDDRIADRKPANTNRRGVNDSDSSNHITKNRKQTGKESIVRTSQLYRHAARYLDAVSFYICSLVIICVPIILFVICPLIVPNPEGQQPDE